MRKNSMISTAEPEGVCTKSVNVTIAEIPLWYDISLYKFCTLLPYLYRILERSHKEKKKKEYSVNQPVSCRPQK